MAKGYSLSIGLNTFDPTHYGGSNGKLNAPEKDATDIQALAKSAGFSTEVLLSNNATRGNVLAAINNAAANLVPGDIFLLFYSGHGGRLPDLDGDEDDGTDETWCLYDGQLIDDELKHLWAKFKEDVRIFILSDSCHSGTIAKQYFETEVSFTEQVPKAMPDEIALTTYTNNQTFYDELIGNVNRTKAMFNEASIKSNVRLISGCQDNQYSYDGPFNSSFTEKLKIIWNGAKFSGNYSQFHLAIQRLLPPYQSPNHLIFGKPDFIYNAQIPFTIDSSKHVKNNFLIDLGVLELTNEQVFSIDSALQKTVSSELAKLNTKGEINLIPIGRSKGMGFDHDHTFGYKVDF